jgi:carboxylesterase
MSLSPKCLSLINDELTSFEADYQQYYLDGETKPKNIGEPFILHHPSSNKGVLLIHGLMAAPEEVREWAEFLFAQGYTVYAPRMKGHGTSADDLSARQMSEWLVSVNRGHEILKCCCERIVIAGFSTGAAVALHQVIKKPEAFDSLISISAPLKFKKISANFASPVNYWNKLLKAIDNPLLRTNAFRKEFVTNHADNPHINYLRCPVSSIVQIQRLMKEVYKGLPGIQIPTLIIHANRDPKVDIQSSRDIFERIEAGKKYYQEIDFHLHGIIRGPVASKVFDEVASFLDDVNGVLKDDVA